MIEPDLLAAVAPVVNALEGDDVPYCVVGSVASSAHGIARSSLDADLVADLRPEHVAPLVAALENDYYIAREAVEEAVRRKSMFNVVHLGVMLKVDVYVLTTRPFDRDAFGRRQARRLDPRSSREYFLATPEDTVLHKLDWYRAGGEVADRQWGDVVGVLKVQGDALDLEYLRRWADPLGVRDLLDRAMRQAGLP